MERADFPRRHAGKRVNHDAERWAKVQRSVSEGGAVALIGNRGTGKTQLAVDAGRDMIVTSQHSVRYVKARMLGMAVRQHSFAAANRDELAAIERWAKPHLLILDDLHEIADDREWERSTLTLILDLRYDHARPTILVANTTPEKFPSMAGPSICDRMREGGGMIVFGGPSLRGKRDGDDDQRTA